MSTQDSAPRPAKRTRRGNLTQLVEPVNLTLVTQPANRTAFKVRRDAGNRDTETIKGAMTLDRFKREVLALGDPAKREAQHKETLDTDEGTDESTEDTKSTSEIMRPARRVRAKPIDRAMMVEMILPEGVDQESAEILGERLDLTSGYSLVEREGQFVYKRNGKRKTKRSTTVTMPNGITAVVDTSGVTYRASGGEHSQDALTLRSISIAANTFESDEELDSWINDLGMQVERDDDHGCDADLQIPFTDSTDEDNSRVVTLRDGIDVTVCQSHEPDIPQKIYREIAPVVFGSYHAHVDFVNAIVDVDFSQKSRSAVSMLEDILYSILFWHGGEVTREEQKQLIANATSQFADYMNMLLDALPEDAVNEDISLLQRSDADADADNGETGETASTEQAGDRDTGTTTVKGRSTGHGEHERQSVRRDSDDSEQTDLHDSNEDISVTTKTTKTEASGKDTSKTKGDGTKTSRSDTDVTDTGGDTGDTSNQQQDEGSAKFVSHEELPDLINSAVKNAFGQIFRSDEQEKEEEVDPMVKAMQAIAEGQAATTEAIGKLVERMDKVEDKVEDQETETVTREDGEDATPTKNNSGGRVKRSDDEIFAGLFGNLGGISSRSNAD